MADLEETLETAGENEPQPETTVVEPEADEQTLAVPADDEDDLEDEEPETVVTCTEHTPENLRGYVILLVVSVFILISSIVRVAGSTSPVERTISALAILIAAIAAALAAYMLFVWKNRQVVVSEDGVVLTDFLGKESTYAWDQVRIVDRRTTSTVELVFRMGKREESFASTCGGFRRMCELLIRMGKLRRIDERALAKKRKAKSLFDVVQGGRREEKVDESLYLPEEKPADKADDDVR